MRKIDSVAFKTAVESRIELNRCRGYAAGKRRRRFEVIVDDSVDQINLGGDEAVVEYKNGAVYRYGDKSLSFGSSGPAGVGVSSPLSSCLAWPTQSHLM